MIFLEFSMDLIKPKFEILEQQSGIDGIYKMIELSGRTCYRSENKITEDSAKKFVDRMIESEHLSMLEQGTVYLDVTGEDIIKYQEFYCKNPYSKVYKNTLENGWKQPHLYVSTNYRVIIENKREDDLKYLCNPTEYHEKRICIKFVSDIHFYKDCTRHRVFSWAIESSRFCNYLKERFGSSVSFAIPVWLKENEKLEFEDDLKTVESIYFKWLKKGWQPQQAAYFLIQGTKAEIIMTGFASDFKHFFDLRSEIAKTGKAHPTVVELVEPLRQEFIKRRLV